MNTKYNRLPIQTVKYLIGNEYKILDYMLYRNSVEDWRFWTSDIAKETGTSLDTVQRILQIFIDLQFVTQDNSHHYHLNYSTVEQWIDRKIESKEKTAKTKVSAEIRLDRKNEMKRPQKRNEKTAKTKVKEIYKKKEEVQVQVIKTLSTNTVKTVDERTDISTNVLPVDLGTEFEHECAAVGMPSISPVDTITNHGEQLASAVVPNISRSGIVRGTTFNGRDITDITGLVTVPVKLFGR